MSEPSKPTGPDLAQGIPLDDLADGGMIGGHVGEEAVLLARRGDEFFAIGSTCSHYGGPLADGLVVGDTVRCPWHHACFSLRTGEAVAAPAFNPVSCWRVQKRDGKACVRREDRADRAAQRGQGAQRQRECRARGDRGRRRRGIRDGRDAAARRVCRQRHAAVSADDAAPYDRPNCSKDYLAGNAPEDWIPLKPRRILPRACDRPRARHRGDRHRREGATRWRSRAGDNVAFDKLLLATGAEPIRLDIPGANEPHVHMLRSLADARAIIANAEHARRAVVVGASFIGLEVAASLRARELEVHVVAPERRPMERVLGREFGDFIRELHEEHGVVFHLDETVTAIDGKNVRLKGGTTLPADLVVVGIGVRPRVRLAEQAGLTIDRGVVVNAYLETSAPGIYAAGDIARWPDPHSGENAPGRALGRCRAPGPDRRAQHARAARALSPTCRSSGASTTTCRSTMSVMPRSGTQLEIEGDIKARDCLVRYRRDGKLLAVASIYRDVDSLKEEWAMERRAT